MKVDIGFGYSREISVDNNTKEVKRTNINIRNIEVTNLKSKMEELLDKIPFGEELVDVNIWIEKSYDERVDAALDNL